MIFYRTDPRQKPLPNNWNTDFPVSIEAVTPKINQKKLFPGSFKPSAKTFLQLTPTKNDFSILRAKQGENVFLAQW